MKKLFIGCGVLLLIGLGTLGFAGYRLWPQISEALDKAERFQAGMTELEREHPFDPEAVVELDTERFVSYLELRVEAQRELATMVEEVRAFEQRIQDEEVGVFESMGWFISQVSMSYEFLLPLLEAHGMGPVELGFYTRVLWATLENIDSGGAGDDPQLNRLRGVYPKLRASYEEVQHDDAQPLEKLLAGIDASVVRSARIQLGLDVDRVEAGLVEPDVEAVFLIFSVNGFGPGTDVRFRRDLDRARPEDDGGAPPEDG